jgi:hypothetical protein
MSFVTGRLPWNIKKLRPFFMPCNSSTTETKNTLIHTQFINFENDDCHSATARNMSYGRESLRVATPSAKTHF